MIVCPEHGLGDGKCCDEPEGCLVCGSRFKHWRCTGGDEPTVFTDVVQGPTHKFPPGTFDPFPPTVEAYDKIIKDFDDRNEPRLKYEDELIAWKPLKDDDFVEQLENLDKLFPPESSKGPPVGGFGWVPNEDIGPPFTQPGRGESLKALEAQRELNRLVQDRLEKEAESRKLGGPTLMVQTAYKTAWDPTKQRWKRIT